MRAEEAKVYHDPGDMFAGLLKGGTVTDDHDHGMACPFFKGDQLKDGREDESKSTLDSLILLPISNPELQLQLFFVFYCI